MLRILIFINNFNKNLSFSEKFLRYYRKLIKIEGENSPENEIGSRESPITWRDYKGTLWLFGGFTYNNGNFIYF